MKSAGTNYKRVIRHPFLFLWQVISRFRENQGLLLSGAIAYYTLLSIIPLITLILLVLSQFVDQAVLLETLRQQVELLIPAQSQVLVEQIDLLLSQRDLVGWLMVGVLLFFSSMAFTVLENAMSLIFFHRVAVRCRHFLISAILPYLYILALGIGFLIMTLISGMFAAVEEREVLLFGVSWSFGGASGSLLYLLGFVGQILMLTSFYFVMPVGKLSLRHALVGGVTAAVLWEIMRHFLVWYFSTLSFVGVVYGSLATAIIVLISLEVAGMILLFGAQVIAEYERFGDLDRDG
ncbi:YihY/virulence factor BrkB family protein [Candidatus Vondammii sp. HM_W22]|uniref:YihY/virulence factor BrkB family protein n=1 Tax=Candidatus Vondammii sp. HM_W22 TaxID=2687299 RepID=UPI001F135D3B|nr:YihY/virulence factor BrkB family protein [Candidatus Vondammii sp. HM_W22]